MLERFKITIINVIGNFNTYYQYDLKKIDKEKDKFFRWGMRK